ncbi:MAG: GYD domain-containing protein [Chloroflexota bacterium]|nr:GYD domain-containing protein [Chloroflexota bacterium]MDE2841624.1 GYD domain-containing protein [Chloroflexota bacterium]
MNTYVVLLTMTSAELDDVAGPIEDAFADGAPETRQTIERHGGKLVEVYLTMGQYDGVLIAEFPDDIACARAMLALRNSGGITQTLRAFPESQWHEIAGDSERTPQ